MRAVLAGLGLVVLLGGCANIPDQTMPQAVRIGGGANAAALAVPAPPKDAGPLDIVRGFVNVNAEPTQSHAAALAYLADPAKSSWKGNGPATIIGDIFSTTFGQDVTRKANEQTVVLRAQQIGQLDQDNSFEPKTGDFQLSLRVVLQSDGTWRIANPPDGLVILQSAFNRYYRQVKLYFFDPNMGALVPDLRYVTADPANGIPAQVVSMLLSGPSVALTGAVKSAIPAQVETKTNVSEAADGTIVVNLTYLPNDLADHVKQLIIAQFVMSLQGLGSGVVVQSEGVPLIQGHAEWRVGDLPSYSLSSTPGANQAGLVVAHDRVYSLKDGSPLAGPAGNGQYQVISAAQSIDGSELAMVVPAPTGGQQLRIGHYGAADGSVPNLAAAQFTRPTWWPSDPNTDPSRELWTVADGQVVRVDATPLGTWAATPVDASLLTGVGPISDLRLSRDGARVAAIAGGHLVVGAVVIDQGSVTIKQVTVLQSAAITAATRVDWQDQSELVVATSQPGLPMFRVTVDGQKLDQYNSSNLNAPVTAVAAAPGRQVLAVDSAGMWASSDVSEVWLPYPHGQGPGSIPFYPG